MARVLDRGYFSGGRLKIWPWHRRIDVARAQEMMAEIEQTRAHRPYSKMDRYRDFRQLFMGSEQGKRVLYELLAWGNQFQSSVRRGNYDPYQTMFYEGQRSIATDIIRTLSKEPPVLPTSTKDR